jgi:hypothetical protein
MQLVAVDFLPPDVLQQQMLRVSSLLAAGQITPLCSANYSLTSVVAAMRLLAQASHVGKVCQHCQRGLSHENHPHEPVLGALGAGDDCVGSSHSIYTPGRA